MDVNKIKVLFVCTGNICRSPLAEGIFKQILKDEGISSSFMVDSAGTEDYHVGSPPDSRSVKIAENNGLSDLNHKARQFLKGDFDKFDYILVMDHLNYDAVISKTNKHEYHE
jgi:protein-tyrosine-phosphatase